MAAWIFKVATLILITACNSVESEGVQRRGSNTASGTSATGELLLTWNAGETSITSYEVYFGKSEADTFSKVATLTSYDKAAPAAVVRREDVGVEKGDTACFYVVAVNAKGSSAPSDKLCQTVPN